MTVAKTMTTPVEPRPIPKSACNLSLAQQERAYLDELCILYQPNLECILSELFDLENKRIPEMTKQFAPLKNDRLLRAARGKLDFSPT